MGKRDKLSGNEAVAIAMRQINPGVVAAFPITPSTEVPQYFASFVNDGLVDTEFIPVESEHSAMSASIAASAAGVRTMTATSSNGLSYMYEMLYIASMSRTPVILNCVNRTVSGPLNIHCDHGDSMGARDSGWIQVYSETNQEAYDNLIIGTRVAEDPSVMLPFMNCYDGFITSHSVENIELMEDAEVKEFVGEYNPAHALLKSPCAMGPFDSQLYYFEHKRHQAEGMKNAKAALLKYSKEFAKITGRNYQLFEEYKLDDAEIALVIIGSSAGTAKYVTNQLRAKGIKAGVLKIRAFRPFPFDEIGAALKHLKAIAVMDKCTSLNDAGGPLYLEVRSALYDQPTRPFADNYLYGLGGRDVKAGDLESVYMDLLKIVETGSAGNVHRYLGLIEQEVQ